MPQFSTFQYTSARSPAPPNPERVALRLLGEAAGTRLSDFRLGDRSAGRNPQVEATRRALGRLPAAKAIALIDQAEIAAYGKTVSKAVVAPVVPRPVAAKLNPETATALPVARRVAVSEPATAAQTAAARQAAADAVWAKIRGRAAATSK